MFFRLFSTIKVNHVAKIMQSAYSCVIFHLHHKKSPSLAVLPWFLILGKIQDSGQDGDHCWSQVPAAPPPIKYTSFCRKDQRLSTEGKIVSKYCQISKTVRGISSPPPPPTLYHGGGMNLHVRPRVNVTAHNQSINFNVNVDKLVTFQPFKPFL